MEELDARPPVPHITFQSDHLTDERKQHIAAVTADLVRSAAGDEAFDELWLAETLGDALVDADTAALVLCDLADLAVMLTRAIAASKDLRGADVVEHVARRWVDQTK